MHSRIAFFVAMILVVVLVPLMTSRWWRKKTEASYGVFFFGALTFFIAVFVLETPCSALLMVMTPLKNLKDMPILLGIYAGLMAGLFEETGRFLLFRSFRKKNVANHDANAIMAGLGHGGCEAVLILGMTLVGNIVMLLTLRPEMFAELPQEQAQTLKEAYHLVANGSVMEFLPGLVERFIAIGLHVNFAILVWGAVIKGRAWLYPLAIIIHAFVNFIAVVAMAREVNIWLIEGAMALILVLVSLLGASVYSSWKSHDSPTV